jgi:DNA-binding transcriptional LysR family regulator
MDRIDAMRVFVAAVDEGSLVGASRKLDRSAAAVSRAIAFLEEHVGTPLLHRTTRSIKLSEAGEHYVAACRRVLTDLEEADMLAASEKSAPRGMLSLAVPVAAGEELFTPVLDAFLAAYPGVSVRLLLLDRPANLVEDGIDVALRIGPLADSNLVAVRVGEVRRVVAASPHYLAQHPSIEQPADLTRHQIIAMRPFGVDSWCFPQADGAPVQRIVQLAPRLIVDSVRIAVAAAVNGRGVTRLYSHHIADEMRAGELRVVLSKDEHPPCPAYLVAPPGRLSVPKVRAFIDFAVPRLRARFTGPSEERREPYAAVRAPQQVYAQMIR